MKTLSTVNEIPNNKSQFASVTKHETTFQFCFIFRQSKGNLHSSAVHNSLFMARRIKVFKIAKIHCELNCACLHHCFQLLPNKFKIFMFFWLQEWKKFLPFVRGLNSTENKVDKQIIFMENFRSYDNQIPVLSVILPSR